MKQFFDDIRAKVRAITSERDKLEQELEQLRQERDHLMTAPPPKEEFFAKLDAAVDETAAHYVEKLRYQLRGQESNARDSLSPLAAFAVYGNERQSIQWAIFALLGPQVKEGLRRLYNEHVDWPEAGPPKAEREKRLAVLDKKIAECEAALDQMTEEANAAGLRIGTVERGPRKDLFAGGRPMEQDAQREAARMDAKRQGAKRGK